jgi:hypothetical protein
MKGNEKAPDKDKQKPNINNNTKPSENTNKVQPVKEEDKNFKDKQKEELKDNNVNDKLQENNTKPIEEDKNSKDATIKLNDETKDLAREKSSDKKVKPQLEEGTKSPSVKSRAQTPQEVQKSPTNDTKIVKSPQSSKDIKPIARKIELDNMEIVDQCPNLIPKK